MDKKNSIRMNRMPGSVILFAATGALLTCIAETQFHDYWRLNSSDPNSATGSSFTRETWQNPDGSATLEAPSAGRKYYVPTDVILRTPWNQHTTFAGDELAVAGTLYDGTGNNYKLTVPKLRLLPGGRYQYSNSSILSSDGELHIEGTPGNPSTVQFFYFANRMFKIDAPLFGGRDSVVRFVHNKETDHARAEFLATGLILENERAGFAGKMVIGTNAYVRLDTKRYFPGEIEVQSNGFLGWGFWNGTTTLGGLTLNPGAQLLLQMTSSSAYNLYTVTNSFAASGVFGISPTSQFHLDMNNISGMPIIRLSGPAAQSSADISNADLSNLTLGKYGPLPRNRHLEYAQNGTSKDVRIAWDDMLVMKQANVASGGDSGTSQFASDKGSYWSTSNVPSSDFEGDVFVLGNNFTFEKNADVNYPKMSVTKLSNGSIYHQANSVTFRELNIVGASVFSYAGSTSKTINGRLICWPAATPTRFIGRANIMLTINAEISGAGDLLFTTWPSQTSAYNVELTAANTGFSGNATLASTDKTCTLYLNDGRNLGGAYSGETSWKAFTISNNSHVVVNDDVTLDEPTRGVFVTVGAQFDVPEGKRFEIYEPFTWGGSVTKVGNGTLVLGGVAQFSDGSSSPTGAPVSGKNALVISAGSLAASATNALDGVAVTFASGASLMVNMAPADEWVRRYGFICRKNGGSLVSQAADGKIHVRFDKDALPEPADSVCEVAICTVSTGDADALDFALDDSYRSCTSEVCSRDNGDGSETFFVRVVFHGFKFIIR